MGLLRIMKKQKEKEKELRFLILGLDNAGKTTLLKKFNGESIDSISPTLGFRIQTLEFKGFNINFWDIGGQKSIRTFWRNYFQVTDALLWVADASDVRRLNDCRSELHSVIQEERLLGCTLLIFANKSDLPNSLSAEEIKDALDLSIITTHHWMILDCSAVTGHNLLPGMEWLVNDVSSRIFDLKD
uniref:ADP-ribosylation factor-like protein 2 n=1 Tax=Caligus rogercresseyi TaxID=217165 RepID=C1BRF3_CALRO|nr:ADP-ribosylation factor-like protein 2 [Caligus rogercresseyi]